MWRVDPKALLRACPAGAGLPGGRTLVRATGVGSRSTEVPARRERDPMPPVPRTCRTEPSADPHEPERPLAVEVTMIWRHGGQTDFDGLAVAWTPKEVEVEWTTPWGDRRRDWLSADQVRRR